MEVLAVVLNDTLGTEWLRPTDPTAVQDQRVRRPSPLRLWKLAADLRFDDFRVVAFRDPDAVGDTEHVTIDGKSRYTQCVAEHDVRRFSSDTG